MTVLAMIDHLRIKMAIRMTTAQKYEYKANGHNTPWNPTTSITAYFTLLDHFQVLLGNCGIATSNEEKTMTAGAKMWQSEMFTEDQMVVWENKGATAQAWVVPQTYFTEKWLEHKQYSATMAKQLRFKEAALLAQETAAAKEEGKTQAMLAHKADYTNGGDEQDKYGCHDGANECSCGGGRSQTGLSAGQGEHLSGRECHPPRWWQPHQDTQVEDSPLS
jgi:hypothetical protein